MAQQTSKVRVLMLHGFAQSDSSFQIKTRTLTRSLRATLARCYDIAPLDIELVFPSGPLELRLSDLSGKCIEGQLATGIGENWAWWQNLDVTNPYIGLESSLAALNILVQQYGPFAGVVGFSQGAALAAMFTSWCESGTLPGRHNALEETSRGNSSLSELLAIPPQRPLDFAICFSGFRGTMEYYQGFYSPKIATPMIHVLGVLDTMVTKAQTEDLLHECIEPTVIYHPGVHFVPRDRSITAEISRRVQHILIKATAKTIHDVLTHGHEDYYLLDMVDKNRIPIHVREISSTPPLRCSLDTASDVEGHPISIRSRRLRIARRYRLSR